MRPYRSAIVAMFAALAIGLSGCELRIESKDCPIPREVKQRKTKKKCPFGNCPPANIPRAFRQGNYGGGSCNHAAMITILRYHGLYKWADRWRRSRWGGIGAAGLADLAESDGLRFAYTLNGDAKFLDWCSRTRRPAAIHYYDNHAITFCGYVNGNAILIDNNETERLIRVRKAAFVQNWRGYGGKAIAVLYEPPIPKPWI